MTVSAWFFMSALLLAPGLASARGNCDSRQQASRTGDSGLTLAALVTPSTVVSNEGRPLPFALYGLIEFQSVNQMFAYVDEQAGRWRFPTSEARRRFADELMRRGVESRIVSMTTETPLEILLTHTPEELKAAVACLPDPVYQGRDWSLDRSTYLRALQRVQERWSHSVNCWSNSSSMPGRVLSNWYLIEEGIELYGAPYDSTEHFWQAVKYHPDVKVADLLGLLDILDKVDWNVWLAHLDRDQQTYLANAYAVEFLRANLTAQHRAFFREQLQAQPPDAKARALQQRSSDAIRFTARQEKVLWGDLADVFHLLVYFNPAAPIDSVALVEALRANHFDAIYLGNKRLGFISPEFRALMLDMWRVKYLQTPRFGQVIRSIPREWKLDHFLSDGDSPDIPIPVYVGYLNEIRRLAWAQTKR